MPDDLASNVYHACIARRREESPLHHLFSPTRLFSSSIASVRIFGVLRRTARWLPQTANLRLDPRSSHVSPNDARKHRIPPSKKDFFVRARSSVEGTRRGIRATQETLSQVLRIGERACPRTAGYPFNVQKLRRIRLWNPRPFLRSGRISFAECALF